MLGGNDTAAAWVDAPRLSAAEVVNKANQYYGRELGDLDKGLPLDDTSYLVVMFKDIAGTVYLRKRPFTFSKEKGINHHASEFFYWLP
jgi:hypothetical protein